MNKNTWNGGLTIENIEDVSKMILEKLSGNKYCFVSQNYGYTEEGATNVRTDQNLENGTNGCPLSFWHGKNNEYAGFNFCDTYGVWGASTSKHNEDLICGWDSTYNAPYIVIDYTQIKIIQRNGHGDVLCWIIAIQDTND